ncbi:hypothetical protein P8C59_004017 [Phyllachora maydis]|uniref:Calcineurin-like phosphoesterase domain-containing protein n=1 Tax=Phyllachora maydis TaxID=1825666 RepID=A0AAD9I1V3_9PEZI|nr:hypothetical protein P8C59_004017 [Phyllachora maydis]
MPDPTYTSTTSTRTRRTRFVCISDTHNRTPFRGNHDITLDRDFYTEHGAYFHNQAPQDPSQCLSLLTSSPSVTYLAHSSATVRLSSAAGPRTTFTVFGSPYSPRDGLWAFAYDRSTPTPSSAPAPAAALASATASPARPALPAAANLWSAIPLATDILVTHAPPRAHGDECATRGRALGCEDLRRALWRVRPRLHVCGHVHEGRGAARVRWALAGRNVAWAEEGTTVWEDPGRAGAKMSLVDLTGRGGGGSPLENDGAVTGRLLRVSCACVRVRVGLSVPVGPDDVTERGSIDDTLRAWDWDREQGTCSFHLCGSSPPS